MTAKLETQSVVESVSEVLRDFVGSQADIEIRVGAVKGLGESGDVASLSFLAGVMRDAQAHTELRAAAAEALGRLSRHIHGYNRAPWPKG